ncbi:MULTISPECIES: ERF family protein [Moraxella]|uniref:ERF superfamily n=2 Tax=Moraxella TaxID=475 RepID=A0A378QM74_9GAMM|nr:MULTISPECIES: ERF family protein [Moraxella]OPH36262.1 hypothetical protein B5J93_09395 [Moraxella equi]STY93397.1 ERF superfamily [Moraxella bovis]STZ01989.1 ERF superfamily [Moraxella equi]
MENLEVFKAINAIQAELAKTGIAKDKQAGSGNYGYKFRGIDDVYNALSPLLAKHHLIVMPRYAERVVTEKQGKNGILFYVSIRGEFDFISAVDGSKYTATTFGEAMDSGDKATNKAMSIAYKYACFQVFAIPTEGDNDPDATIHQGVQNTMPTLDDNRFNEACNAVINGQFDKVRLLTEYALTPQQRQIAQGL